MRKPRRALTFALVAAAGLAAFTGAGSAAASTTPTLTPLPGAWVAPLQFAVGGSHVYVADSGTSALYQVGAKAPIAVGPKANPASQDSGDTAGVAVNGDQIAYGTTKAGHRDTYLTVLQGGKRILKVNLGAYERANNPDKVNHYGVADPSTVPASCKKEIAKAGAPLSYTGQKDSHVYAVAAIAQGGWLVADAGGNDILHVEPSGRITTFAVLPPQPVTVTKALAKELHAPHCVGVTYAFEPVPTDVAIGPDAVYVTTLPGGDGGVGSVYRVDWHTFAVTQVATGFPEATNLAVSDSGQIYVVSLGQGVYTPSASGPQLVAKVPGAAAVEWCNGKLYVSTAPAVLGGKGLGRIYVVG